MVATTNKALELPARGSLVGTWDTPVNDNMGIIDNSFGGVATIPLTNSNVTLSAAQYQCAFIVFTGTLSANIVITFPSVGSFYNIQNRTSGNFTITLTTTAASAQAIGCPPYEPFDILTDGTNTKFRNLGRVGTYEQYGGSSVPTWITACTVPPYLNCDGTTFSSATYPALRDILGTTTLPDHQGRAFFALNGGTGRITTASGGLDGNTIFSGGGAAAITLSASQGPIHGHNVTDPSHTHNSSLSQTVYGSATGFSPGSAGFSGVAGTSVTINVATAVTGLTVDNSTGGGPHNNVPPGLVGGIVMIRAA